MRSGVGAFWKGSRFELRRLVFFFFVEEADDLEAPVDVEALACCGLGAAAAGDALKESEQANAASVTMNNAGLEGFFISLCFSSCGAFDPPFRSRSPRQAVSPL